MIWLLLNGWWLVVLAIALPGLIALLTGLWPAVLAILRRMPDRLLAALVAALVTVVAVSLTSGWLVRVGEERCRAGQLKAEDRADVKAAKVAGRAAEKAETDTTTIRKETSDVQVRIREVVRTVPGDCPPMPDELHDLLQRQVESACAELPAGACPGNP